MIHLKNIRKLSTVKAFASTKPITQNKKKHIIMKFCAILLIISILDYTKGQKCNPANIGVVINRCLNKHHGTEIDILDLLVAKKARSDNAKCFRSCLMIECENMDYLGRFSSNLPQIAGQILGAGDNFRTAAVEEVAFDCVLASDTKGDICNIAEDFMQCVIRNCKHCQLAIPKLKI